MKHHCYSKVDRFLIELQNTFLDTRVSLRVSPALELADVDMSDADRQYSARLMRVNHTGEVCAQALYLGQALVAKDEATRVHMLAAADEEVDHLHWCAQRLRELESRTSLLNVMFFSLSVLTGMVAGLASDKISLGFIAETEKQVAAHLATHLEKLPADDLKSRAIVAQMQLDEIKHQQDALDAGGEILPDIVQYLMRFSAKCMTSTTQYI